MKPSYKRALVPEQIQRFGSSQRQALRVVRMSASVYLYRSVARGAEELKMRIREITNTRVHYGYRRVHGMLRREGFQDNVKRVYRLHRGCRCDSSGHGATRLRVCGDPSRS